MFKNVRKISQVFPDICDPKVRLQRSKLESQENDILGVKMPFWGGGPSWKDLNGLLGGILIPSFNKDLVLREAIRCARLNCSKRGPPKKAFFDPKNVNFPDFPI